MEDVLDMVRRHRLAQAQALAYHLALVRIMVRRVRRVCFTWAVCALCRSGAPMLGNGRLWPAYRRKKTQRVGWVVWGGLVL